jgi:hypothetical protein
MTEPTKTAKEVNNDPFKSPKETWQYVTIPEKDFTDIDYPTISLNKLQFKAGQTYHVPAQVAAYVQERMRAYDKSVVRLFSPSVDRGALNTLRSVGTASAGEVVDGATIRT